MLKDINLLVQFFKVNVLYWEVKIFIVIKTLKLFDHYLNKWSFLPDMQIARSETGVVTQGNKLFVTLGIDIHFNFLNTSEVYDSISQKFTFIASSSKMSSYLFCSYFKENNIIKLK